MSPSWYDVLGVAPDATPDEVRAAWRTAIADLDPGEARFATLNRAAEVLLDPGRRAEHDTELALPNGPPDGTADPEPAPEPDPRPGESRWHRWQRVAAGVAATVVVALVAGAASYALDVRRSAAEADAVRDARAAAEEAVVPVLSYDHRDLEAGKEAAQAHLTARYRKEYDQTHRLVADNAPALEAVVQARLVDSAVVRPGRDRVQVLLFVDQETSNKETSEPLVYRNHVTATMQRVDGEWLVDELRTRG